MHVPVVIVGAGPGGLAMSHHLTGAGVDHVVLERGEVGNSWRRERWDSLRLLTPNWMTALPGYRYEGDDPNGFMTATEAVEFLDGVPPALRSSGPHRGHGRVGVPHGRRVRRPHRSRALALRRRGGGHGCVERSTRPGARRGAASRHRPAHRVGVPATRRSSRGAGRVLVVGASASGRADRRRALPCRARGHDRRR